VPRASAEPLAIASVSNEHMCGLFEGAVDATAESVCNALTAATTTVGRDGNTAYALPLDRLVGVLRRAGREARLPGA
jgi:D-aminopeptidase